MDGQIGEATEAAGRRGCGVEQIGDCIDGKRDANRDKDPEKANALHGTHFSSSTPFRVA